MSRLPFGTTFTRAGFAPGCELYHAKHQVHSTYALQCFLLLWLAYSSADRVGTGDDLS